MLQPKCKQLTSHQTDTKLQQQSKLARDGNGTDEAMKGSKEHNAQITDQLPQG